MQKRLKLISEEIMLIDEAVRFYLAFLERCDEYLEEDRQQAINLVREYHNTNDLTTFEELQCLNAVVQKGIRLCYGTRTACLRAIHRRLSAIKEGKALHSGSNVRFQWAFMDNFEPVDADHIAYWTEGLLVNKKEQMKSNPKTL